MRKSVPTTAVSIRKRNVKHAVKPLGRRLHAKSSATELEPADRERASIGKPKIARRGSVGHEGHPVLVLRVALVPATRLCQHAREGVGVDLVGVRGHVRDAAAGEGSRYAGGEGREVGKREEAAIALAKRHPPRSAKLREPQVLEVPDDGVCQEALEVVRLEACGVDALAPCLRGKSLHAGAVDARGAAAASLVRQHHPEVPDGLLHPAVARRGGQTRARAAGTSLQKHNERQVTAHVLGRADNAVEELDPLPRKGRVGLEARGLGGQARRARVSYARKRGRGRAAPVKRHLYGMVLDGKAGQVVLGKQRQLGSSLGAMA